MTQEEITAMAREAGFVLADNATDEALNRFRAFAALVAAREREACAVSGSINSWQRPTFLRQQPAPRRPAPRAC